jgi:transposase
LKVSRQSVSRWHRQWKRGGTSALRAAGRAGRKPRLTPAQLLQLDQALRGGARAHGFRTDRWTLPRVARVLERETALRYHPGHVWKLLRALGWTLQRPARRARERDETAIRQWMAQRWPTVKKNARRQRAWMIFQDESGISERPSIRRTWVPREEKPVLVHAYNWKKLSLCGAIAYRWDGRRARLLFQTTSGSYDGKKLIGFLKELRQEFRDRRVILIWDGLPARRSRQVQACLWGNGSGCTRSGCRATRPN